MRKLRLLIAVATFAIMSCTNQGSKQNDESQAAPAFEEEAIIDMHTSEISLDWAGVYEGTMPCASCEGIETVVELKDDHTFTASFTYIGGEEDFTTTNEGKFTWDDSGQIVTLVDGDDTSQYKVGENHIILLNENGEVNTGELAEFYVLQKKM